MKLGNGSDFALDPTDWKILQTLQEDCKIPLARVGEQVGLSAPSVIDRIKKLGLTEQEKLDLVEFMQQGLQGQVTGYPVPRLP